ncbi:MAG: DNA-protecting protein DprA, partial [Bacteroidia bacterium]|nr:DNA-protecting protein DprA [Bacteroidia bacterium]
PVIISGFAYGTDIIAQRAAVDSNLQTIGCLAHGFEQIYPKSHEPYMKRIMEHGGFFTDFWSIDTFERTNFIKRNRIIAGLSEATVVIESAEKGGSLITADLARSYDREVFAVPGRPSNPYSVGCNNLIKYQQAHMLTQPEDIPYILNWRSPEAILPAEVKLVPELNSNEKLIYDHLLIHDRSSLDSISRNTGLPTNEVASILLKLELRNLIRPLPGKAYEIHT